VLTSARDALGAAVDRPTLTNEMGFVIIHRCERCGLFRSTILYGT